MQDEVPSTATPNLLTHRSPGQEPATRSQLSWTDRILRLGYASGGESWRGVPSSLAFVGLITILGLWIEPVIRGPNLAIFYMLAVVFSALRWGRWAVTLSAILSAFLFDYFFVPPFRSFVVGDVWYLITLVGLLTIGLIVSTLMVATREEARTARRREARMSAIYSFAKSLASGNELDHILDAAARHFFEVFRRPMVVLLPDPERMTVRFRSAELAFDEDENEIASWVFE